MKRVNPFRIAILALVLTALSAASAHADTRIEYVVKFLCGPVTTDMFPVLPGSYATSINIYNPSDKDIPIYKNIALSFPPAGQFPGSVSEVIMETLPAKSALQVDCLQIPGGFSFEMDGAPPMGSYTEGFLVVQSSGPLKVSGVYNATHASGGASLDIEQIQGVKRKVRRRDRDKLTICHIPPGNPSNRHTLRIGSSAWPAHASHGDTEGPCED